MTKAATTMQAPGGGGLRLRRHHLGLCFGPNSQVYLADPGSRQPVVHALSCEEFTQSVQMGRIAARRWAVVIPRRDCLIKRMRLPASTDEEVRQMLEFELPSLVPRQNGEMCHDFLPLWQDEQGYRHVNVVLAYRSRIDAEIASLTGAGIQPEIIIPSSLALFHWLRHGHPERTQSNSILLCGGERQCQMVVCSQGCFLAARELTMPAGSGLDSRPLVENVRRSIEHLEEVRAPGADFHILVVGSEAFAGQVEAQLGSSLRPGHSAPNVTHLEPSVEVVADSDHPVPTETCEAAALCALGASLAASDAPAVPFSLAPASWSERRRRRRRWIDRGTTASTVLCALGLIYAFLAVRNWQLDRQLDAMALEMEPIQGIATELGNKKDQFKVVQSQLFGRKLPLEVLAELYRLLPEDAHINQLTIDLQTTKPQLLIRGSAQKLATAFSIPQALEKSKYIDEVWPEGAQQVKRAGGVLTEFRCRCSLKAPALRKGR